MALVPDSEEVLLLVDDPLASASAWAFSLEGCQLLELAGAESAVIPRGERWQDATSRNDLL
ncbi:hypothetical protein IMZ48_03140 [Candidatus Bathyarchaeota archaeon]|nr:hypothetical protein [Candidatus Bathyarchaeota archaeon]